MRRSRARSARSSASSSATSSAPQRGPRARDPEDVRAALNAFYAQVRADLERFGGTVEKYIGDAVMAVFGAPVAHEDDPERAVRAALAIRDWAREDGSLQVRIAVNTGEALVALGARAEAGEAMVAGDVVNTAARLQSSAPENGVLVGEATHRATREEIEYEAVDGVQAKGKAEPVTAWLAVEARGRVAVELAAAATPLVGRDRERDLLLSAFGRARDDRSTELVTIVGVPGIGKSRLVAELYAELEADDGVHPLAARALAAVRRGPGVLGARRDGPRGGRDPRD